jgi:drug/metabolite transporter (DMT)-like permease
MPDGARTRVPLRGLLLLATLTLLWGANWPAMKVALREIPPLTFRTFCLVTGALGLLALARARGYRLAIPRREWRPLGLAALFNITAWHLLSAYGLTLIQAGRAAIIAYTMPLWTVLLGRLLLGEALTRARLLALGLGLSGMAVLVAPDIGAVWDAPVGALLVLGAALSWAAGTIVMKSFRWTTPTVLLTGWQVALGALPIVVATLLLDRPPSLEALSPESLAGTLYAAVVGILICHYLWFSIVEILPAAIAALATLGIPIVGVWSSALLLGEPVGAGELLALALVLPAVALVLFGR